MSTRSTVHFVSSEWDESHIVYVHHDGYPSYRGKQIMDFLRTVRDEITDSRMGDAGRLAAKFVVYMFNDYYQHAKESDYREAEHLMQTISVNLCNEDPGDIEYRYIVNCDTVEFDRDAETYSLPEVFVQGVSTALVTGAGENMYDTGEPLVEVLADLESDEDE